MLMKVKSDRGLKYVIELIEEMMAKLGIERGDMPSVDYHMPYETTEALVERDLVKVILPPGVTLDENASIASIDVSELIDNASKAAEAATVEEAPTVEELHVDAVHADELVTDEEAEAKIEIIERTVPVSSGTKFVEINLDTICDNYEDDETVDLESLKSKSLVSKNAGSLKVLARGVMTKRLVIIADQFSLQAVKMITLAGGHAEQLK
jgi:ribosomal protein L15